MITIQADVLSAYISKIFAASGSSEEEANIIAEIDDISIYGQKWNKSCPIRRYIEPVMIFYLSSI